MEEPYFERKEESMLLLRGEYPCTLLYMPNTQHNNSLVTPLRGNHTRATRFSRAVLCIRETLTDVRTSVFDLGLDDARITAFDVTLLC